MIDSLEGLATILKTPAVLAVADKYYGLGNRVRSLLGAKVLARTEGRAFAYTWPTGKNFGARFDQLWDFDAPVISTAVSRLAATRFPYRDHKLHWLDDEARAAHLWQVRTPHALVLPPGCPSWESELQALSPSAAVRANVISAAEKGTAERAFIGVMIRTNTNAHKETLHHSPLQWYMKRMGEIRDQWPDVGFYVSADTPAAFLEIEQTFANCQGTAYKGPYNSKQALTASVVDLYMLASSCHLLGPHYSSFPELSQHLAGKQLRLETSMTGPESVLVTLDGLTIAPNPIQPFARRQLG
ncbi:hypothetical protein [Arthrobacter sp. GMC3]|uniref:hypothetical protein n=1 Tax=Arthrobacter sp. GMC3 TaxID=2058894 RepID=UPI0011B0C4BE|nr:hypothetical protein [Arthrobacter sp. GMC3]